MIWIKIQIWESFSWTNWLWYIEEVSLLKEADDNFIWITNIKKLKNKLPEICKNRTQKQITADTKSLFYFLKNIENKFNAKDPILFLYNLYYWKDFELWLKDILKRLNEKWIKISYVCLQKYFTKYFKWQLADKWRQNKRKNKAKSIPWWHWWLWNINLKRQKVIEKKTKELISLVQETKNKIDQILFLEISNLYKIDKITYILYNYWLIKNNSRDDLKSFLKELKKERLWERKIAKIINNIIKNFDFEIAKDLEISQKNIIDRLK